MLAVFLFNRSNATHNRKRTSIEFIQTSYKQVLFTCKRKNVVNALLRLLKERRSWVNCGVVGSGHERLRAASRLTPCEQQMHFRSPLPPPQKSYFSEGGFFSYFSLQSYCKRNRRPSTLAKPPHVPNFKRKGGLQAV